MPDLIIDEPSVQPRLEVMEFDICDCAVDEGCTDSGTRLLLRFATLTQNIGYVYNYICFLLKYN